MSEPLEERRFHLCVAEDLRPFAEAVNWHAKLTLKALFPSPNWKIQEYQLIWHQKSKRQKCRTPHARQHTGIGTAAMAKS